MQRVQSLCVSHAAAGDVSCVDTCLLVFAHTSCCCCCCCACRACGAGFILIHTHPGAFNPIHLYSFKSRLVTHTQYSLLHTTNKPHPQNLREQDLTAIADSGDPIRYSPGELVALAQPGAAATAFYLVTAGEVMLLPASLQIPPGTPQLDVAKVWGVFEIQGFEFDDGSATAGQIPPGTPRGFGGLGRLKQLLRDEG